MTGIGKTDPLLERRGETTAIADVLSRAHAGEGSALLIEGPAGIGKSSLVGAVVECADDLGLRVCQARGGDLEREFAFGVVRQLYEPLVAATSRSGGEALLEGAAAAAAPLVGGAAQQSTPADEAAAQHALHTLVARAAADRPLAIVVDDAHWADRPSLTHLAYLARRVKGLPAALIVATRPATDDAQARGLAEVARAATAFRPRPLSLEATSQLADALLGGEVDRDLVTACHRASGGNPFLLRELLGELRRRPGSAAAEARHVSAMGPGAIARAVLLRLSPLGADAVALARAVAVLGDDTELRHARSLAGLDLEAAVDAADALESAGVLAGGRGMTFTHDLLREAVYEDIPRARRGLEHSRAAEMLAAEGAPPEHAAAHLLQCAPDGRSWAVTALRDAGRAAAAHGAPDVAATFLRRALAEPPEADQRVAILVALGAAEWQVGGPRALALLREALDLSTGPEEKVAIALEIARAMHARADAPAAVEVLEGIRDTAAAIGDEWLHRVDVALLGVGLVDLDSRAAAVRRTEDYRSQFERLTDARLLSATAGALMTSGGPASEAVAIARRALGDEVDPPEGARFLAWALGTLAWADQLDDAERGWSHAVWVSQQDGSPVSFAQAAGHRSHTRWRRGDLPGAEADARASLAVAIETGAQPAVPWPLAFLLDALIDRGALEEACAELAAAGADTLPQPVLDTFGGLLLRTRRARLELALGNAQVALGKLLEAGARLDAVGIRAPAAMFDWRSCAAEALIRIGDRERARQLAEEELELARIAGVQGPIGMAERALALAQDDKDDRLALLRQSAATLEASPRPLELARTLVHLGVAERVAGPPSAGREPLRRALDIADRCGADGLANRAREELVVAGARPRRAQLSGTDALTPSEQRVAALAAEGRSNREIATELFVTVKTVEMHLRSAYRKLGVQSRTELPAALAA